MKFYYDEIVIYKDDGQFPSLNNYECRVIDYDYRMGYKQLEVEFILYNGMKFTHSFHIKRFKKIKVKK